MATQRKSVGNAEHPPTLLGGTAIKPPERHGFDVIKYMIYDKEKGEFFTRTPKSWALIFIFYCIYYTCLACFWYGLLQVFFQFMPVDRPKYTLSSSLIGKNPGVGMAPRQPDATIDSSMLFLKWDAFGEEPSDDLESRSNRDWAERYQRVLDTYRNMTQIKDCPDNYEFNKEGTDACKFDPAVLGDCGQFPFGYQASAAGEQIEPCVLLRINRIFDWKPEEYLDEDLEELPANVRQLVEADRKQVYVDCQGENPADREALEGALTYFPANQGIPLKFFPYTQAHKNYHKPLIAVKFSKSTPRGQLLHIECKVWTKGAVHSSKHRTGQVHFELILDDYDLTKEDK